MSLDGDFDGNPGGNFVSQYYAALPGDVNLDGVVDVSKIEMVDGVPTNVGDASLLLANLGQTSGQLWQDGDFNADGDVDVTQIVIDQGGVQNVGDASILLANLGRSVVSPLASVASKKAFATAAVLVNVSTPDIVSSPATEIVVLPKTGDFNEDESRRDANAGRLPVVNSANHASLVGNQDLDDTFANTNWSSDDGSIEEAFETADDDPLEVAFAGIND